MSSHESGASSLSTFVAEMIRKEKVSINSTSLRGSNSPVAINSFLSGFKSPLFPLIQLP